MGALLIDLFKTWGLPKAIRTDNGLPFGVPSRDVIPILSIWLMAWGIVPILNRPRRPTDNPRVENNQYTSARWAEVYRCDNIKQMEQQLEQAAVLQRDHFKVTRLGNVTRKKLYKKLYANDRTWDKAAFDIQRAYQFLAKAIYPRKISSCGTVALYGKIFSIGAAYRGQVVFFKFDPKLIGWICLNQNKDIIKSIRDHRFDKDNLYNLNLCQ